MLEYPVTQKGYRLLNLVTKLIFVSRDVKFFESIYPHHIFLFVSYQGDSNTKNTGHHSSWIDDDAQVMSLRLMMKLTLVINLMNQ